jgi:anti-sigma factor RsiW
MTHPSNDQLVALLYGEATKEEKEQLRAHLNQCSECAGTLQQLRSTRRQLNRWKVSAPRPVLASASAPILKWGIAAMLLVSCGFGMSSLLAERKAETWRKNLAAQVAAETEQRLAKKFSAQMEETRETLIEEFKQVRIADRQEFIRAFDTLHAQRVADYSELRKGIETVALHADAKLRRNQEEIGQLAILTSMTSSPNLDPETPQN